MTVTTITFRRFWSSCYALLPNWSKWYSTIVRASVYWKEHHAEHHQRTVANPEAVWLADKLPKSGLVSPSKQHFAAPTPWSDLKNLEEWVNSILKHQIGLIMRFFVVNKSMCEISSFFVSQLPCQPPRHAGKWRMPWEVLSSPLTICVEVTIATEARWPARQWRRLSRRIEAGNIAHACFWSLPPCRRTVFFPIPRFFDYRWPCFANI